MHVRRLILLGFALAAWAPAAHAETPATVRMLECAPAQDGDDGTVTYRARMRSVPGTARMTLRFRLLERVPGDRYRRVSAGKVKKSRPVAGIFRWEHTFNGLRQGASYLSKVVYRWLAADGSELQSVTRTSEACEEPGPLPNLRVASIEVRPGEVEETAVYRVKIANRGGSPAGRVGVLLRVDGEVVDDTEVIEVLEPGEVRTVTFTGPVCRRDLRVVVDPKDLITESRERDNVRSPSCL